MAQEPDTGKPIKGDILAELLRRAMSDPAFREKLLNAPADALRDRNIRADPKWVAFFKGLTPSNFESELRNKVATDPEGEGEGEGEGSGGDTAEG